MILIPKRFQKSAFIGIWTALFMLTGVGNLLKSQDSPFPNEGKEQFYYFGHPVMAKTRELINLNQLDEAKRTLNTELSSPTYEKDRPWLLPLGLTYIYFSEMSFEELKGAADQLLAFVDQQEVPNNVLRAQGQLMLNDYWLYYNRNDSAIYYIDRALESYLEGPFQDVITYNTLLHKKFRTYENEFNTEDSLLKYCDIQQEIYDNHYDRIAKHEPPIQKSLIYKRYASVYSRLGDYSKAISYLYEALRLIEQDPEQLLDKEKYAYAKLELTVAHYSNNQFSQANKYAKEVVALFDEVFAPGHIHRIDGYNALAVTYTALNQPDSALIWLNKCREVVAKHDGLESLEAYILLNMGTSYTKTGNELKSRELLLRALRMRQAIFGKRHPGTVDFYRYLAESQAAFGHHELALNSLDSALMSLLPDIKEVSEISQLPSQNLSLNVMDLLEFYLQELVAMQKIKPGSLKTTNIVLDLAALTERALQDKQNDYYETESVLSNARLYKDVFEHALVELALQNPEDGDLMDQAAHLMFTSKNIILNSEIKEFTLIKDAQVPDVLRKKYLETKQRLLKLDNELTKVIATTLNKDSISLLSTQKIEARAEFESISDSLKSTFWPQRTPSVDQQTIANIRAEHNLKDGTALVEFFYGNGDMIIMGVSENTSSLKRITVDTTFRQNLRVFTELASKPDDGKSSVVDFAKLSNYLYAQLIAPVLADLDPNLETLVIIPDGPLGFLSFELLSTNEAGNYDGLNYLINDYRVYYAYSSKKPKREVDLTSHKGLLAFGFSGQGATTERDEFGDLPGAQQEIKFLKSNFKGSYYLGDRGSKELFMRKSEGYDIIHLALHGKADVFDRYNSRLIFNGTGNNEFTAYDLFMLNLNPSMVVLSACETSRGKLETGEGVFSVARSFATKGIPSIVTTLWKVNDSAGSEIITAFYEKLAEGMPKDEALRQAKLAYLKNSDNLTRHPYYWGSFVVIGDTSPIDIKKASSFSWYWLLALMVVIFIISRLGKQPSGKPKI